MVNGIDLVVRYGEEEHVVEVDCCANLRTLKLAIERETGFDMKSCTLHADDQELSGDDAPLSAFGLSREVALVVRPENKTLAASYLAEKSIPVTGGSLLEAINKVDHDTIQLLIEAGVPLNVRHMDTTPLIEACTCGEVAVVSLLLDLRADPNLRGKWRTTPLITAATKGDVDVVRVLIEHKVQLDLADNKGWTALMAAASGGFTDVVELLIDKGADVNTKGDGLTALSLASKKGNTDVVRVLLKAGADVTACAPLLAACENGHTDTARILISRKAPVNYQDSLGWSALMNAAWNNHVLTVKLLLENKANVHLVSKNGHTALKCAQHKGYTSLVNLLSQENAYSESHKCGSL